MRSARRTTALLAGAALVVAGCGGRHVSAPNTVGPCDIVPNGSPAPKTPAAPGIGYRRDMTAVHTAHYAVATANPLASQAACGVLRAGGTAADAVITAQAVLGLVEPESSGIGGGGFLLYYDAHSGSVQAYDGREVAPAAATEDYLRWISTVNPTEPKPDPRGSGRSIGVPGILRLLEDVHNEHGRTPWRDLFSPAITLADAGFAISPVLASAIAAAAPQLRADPQAAAYFLNPDGTPRAAGTRLANPAYSKTLGAIASDGAQAFYSGDIARDVVASATDTAGGRTPSLMTVDDLARYAARERQPLCTGYRGREVCGMPPPSSGGIAVAAALGILEHFGMADDKPTAVDLNGGRPTVMGVHLVSEAERLAYADRDKYVADTDFVPLPGGSVNTLLNKPYLKSRAALISMTKSMGTAQAGVFNLPSDHQGIDTTFENGTNQFTIVDPQGNVLSATTTVESSMGSFHMTNGFLLNNQLTDFSYVPVDQHGPVANRVQGGKRPRSSMSPLIVLDREQHFVAALGSPGGSSILPYNAKTTVGILAWHLSMQQAIELPNLIAHGDRFEGEVDRFAPGVVAGLQQRGIDLGTGRSENSGLHGVQRLPDGSLDAGADSRREGRVQFVPPAEVHADTRAAAAR